MKYLAPFRPENQKPSEFIEIFQSNISSIIDLYFNVKNIFHEIFATC